MRTISGNRIQRGEDRRQRTANVQKGEGLYVFRNSTKGDLQLLKTSADGKKNVRPLEEFRGDSYLMQHVKNHEAIIVECIISPDQERTNNMNKLILDQPDRVTTQGKTEVVVSDIPTPVKLNEVPVEGKNPQDVLINENPIDGVQIILE
jgi:hypothetical protein